MMVLSPLLFVPAAAGLACLLVRSRRAMHGLNVLAFAATLALGVRLLPAVLARGAVEEWGEFLRADALSAYLVLLISVVSRVSASSKSVQHFR